MENKSISIDELFKSFDKIEESINKRGRIANNEQELIAFYNDTLEEFYSVMKYTYLSKEVTDRFNELHLLYSKQYRNILKRITKV